MAAPRSFFDFLPFVGVPKPVVAVLVLGGVIGRVGALRRGLTLSALAPQIERAFRLRRLAAVALAVNSPGGSPVQAALIAGRIRQLADERDVPVYAFCEDVAASGGYWIACAGDEIWAAPASVIGSIGVVSGGFGLEGLIDKLGVERRLHTAGERKAMLDPFQPEKPRDVRHLKELQADIHGDFKDWVRGRRGKRLKAAEKEAFSGAFWTGRRALDMGLIDGLGDMRSVLRQRLGPDVRLREIGARQPMWRRRLGVGGGDSGVWADHALAAIEERLLWRRFGL